jgi:hypothetical protein
MSLLTLWPQQVYADGCDTSGHAGGQFFGIDVACPGDGDTAPGSSNPGQPAQPDPYVAYTWASICQGTPDIAPADLECPGALTCPNPEERRWQLWGQLPNGSWATIETGCFGGTPPEYVPPTVTPADVLSALRRVGLPALETHVQPAGRTLVNFDTIFYAEPRPVDVDLTILGQAVAVHATPTTYQWDFGDGTRLTTSTAGAPYPARTVTHRYQHARTTVSPHVAVTYTARFQVSGGDWQDIDGTVTTVGPATSLRIAEAAAVLSGEHD